MIDYGDVRLAAVGTDAVMLELSLLFHPAGRAISRGWPSPDAAGHWFDLDEYTAACPFASFVRATREWALANGVGVRAVRATAYAHSLRQLKYPDVAPELAVAIARSAVAAW